MSDIFFTSDTHFNHENVIAHDKRPFRSLEEMTDSLISNWNSVVARGDVVYHLGDFAISYGKKHEETVDSVLARLNGSKHLVIGNHDRKEVVKNKRWASVEYYKELKVDLGGVHKQRIVMSHYAMASWNQMHRGSWMLHGHSHGNLPDVGGLIMDVGTNIHNYTPVSLMAVRAFMDGRDIVYRDHHRPVVPSWVNDYLNNCLKPMRSTPRPVIDYKDGESL